MLLNELVLSLYPGIGLLDRGFEELGFCVVRGPDLIWGGDIANFHPPTGRFEGVIGGPPCQDFSTARRDAPTGNGVTQLSHFVRVVLQARPTWWLCENVERVPDVKIAGYSWQRLDIRADDFGMRTRRLRHIQFGSNDGTVLVIARGARDGTEPTVTASDPERTPWDVFCARQGLPPDFDIPAFTSAAKRRAVGNGVPLPMARGLARAVRDRVSASSVTLCACCCGRRVTGRQYAGSACRMRAMRRRRAA